MTATRPNVLLIMTDQQRADFTAGAGFELDTMPFVDTLAARGRRVRNAYTTAPACVPARTSLLTGRYPSAHRVRQNSAVSHVYRGDDLLDVLRGAGYSLHFAGKTHMYRKAEDFDTFAGPYWHETGPDATPEDAAFADWMRSIDHGPALEPTPFPLERQFPHRIVSDAIAGLEQRDPDKPFFSWLSFPEPHNPYQAPEPYFSMFPDVPDRAHGPEAARAKGGMYRWLRELQESKRPGYDDLWRRYRSTYCGMLRLIDDQLRRLFAYLDENGLVENTLVCFIADHGDYVGDYGLQRKGAGMPDILMRIPFVVTGPGVVAGDDDVYLTLADLLPTLCEAVGEPIPYGVQGHSLWPVLTGNPYPVEEFASCYAERGYGGVPYEPDEHPPLHFSYEGKTYDELNTVTQSGFTRMLRTGDWKLLYDNAGTGELYDLSADPYELDNLWSTRPDVRAELLERLLLWANHVVDDLPEAAYTPKRSTHNWWLAASCGEKP